MSGATIHTLGPLINHYGIQPEYNAADGSHVTAPINSILAVLEALGADTDGDINDVVRREQERMWSRALEPVVLAWNGQLDDVALRVTASAARGKIDYEIILEHGDVVRGTLPATKRRECSNATFDRTRRVELAATIGRSLPIGYHQLRVRTADGDSNALILAAPARCYSGDRPSEWGVFAPLYALRQSAGQDIGDFKDLEALMRLIGEMDGDLVATLPISASFLRTPFDPSPYAPASRLFWNELFLNVPDAARATRSISDTHAGVADLVDYRASAEAKRAHVEPVAERFFANNEEKSQAFRAFLELYPNARDYAGFRAAGERFSSGWPVWPENARNGYLTPQDYDEAAMHYHLYAQFVAHTQLRALSCDARASGVRLYLDMPLGVHSDSYDVWRNRDLFVTGASAGAPPDPFFTKGQSWGFPPLNPVRLREQQHAYWRQVLRTQLRYAGILRLDHVMALHRLYFVPHGVAAVDGVYVKYPADELYAVLTIESNRHEAVIVGEDLGTVPDEVREAMAARSVKRMFVVQFEATEDLAQPMREIPKDAVASLNTHDMPTFRAFWEARDAAVRQQLGLLDDAGVADACAARSRATRALSTLFGSNETMAANEARAELLRYLAASPADIVLLNLEDLWLEAEPQNVPGTSQERPNWRRRLKHTISEIREDPQVRELLAMVNAARRSREP